MAPPPPTVITRARRSEDRLEIALVDVADPAGRPLAALDVELPPGRAARITGVRLEPALDDAVRDPRARRLLAGRLLDACADELRSLGRLRVTATVGDDDGEYVDLLVHSGYAVARQADGARDLVLEL